jgi:hypothetical protein
MDFVSALAQQVGIPSDKAAAVAGGLVGLVQGQLKDGGQDKAAAAVGAAVPELGGWQKAAQALGGGGEGGGLGALAGALGGGGGGGGGLGGLLGAATSGQGGGLLGAVAGAVGGEKAQNTVAIVGVLNSVGLDAGKAALVGPLLLQFLESRLDAGTLKLVMQAAPVVAGLVGAKAGASAPAADDDGGGLGGALGKLFG